MSNGFPAPDRPGPKTLPKELMETLVMLNISDLWGKILLAEKSGMIAEIGWTHTKTAPEPKGFTVRAIRLPGAGDDEGCIKDVHDVHLTRGQPSTVLPFNFSDVKGSPATGYILVVDLYRANSEYSYGNNITWAEALPYDVEFKIWPDVMAHATA